RELGPIGTGPERGANVDNRSFASVPGRCHSPNGHNARSTLAASRRRRGHTLAPSVTARPQRDCAGSPAWCPPRTDAESHAWAVPTRPAFSAVDAVMLHCLEVARREAYGAGRAGRAGGTAGLCFRDRKRGRAAAAAHKLGTDSDMGNVDRSP